MQPPCLTRAPTIALRPFHSRRSGLSNPEELATSSIIAPSRKISPVLMMQLSIAFDNLFAFRMIFGTFPFPFYYLYRRGKPYPSLHSLLFRQRDWGRWRHRMMRTTRSEGFLTSSSVSVWRPGAELI